MTIKYKPNRAKGLALGAFVALFGVLATGVLTLSSYAASDKGFNENGYNYSARVFSGVADGVDRNLDGTVWGDPTYANDHLVMKWNKAWDDCNDNGYNDPDYCLGAWTTNQWNGMRPDGSKWTEHVKVIWVGSELENSPYWVEGGYAIWNNYEVIFDKGKSPDGAQNTWALASPAGLGANKNL